MIAVEQGQQQRDELMAWTMSLRDSASALLTLRYSPLDLTTCCGLPFAPG
jgi:hypothetical protein